MSTNDHYISTGGQPASLKKEFVPSDYEFFEAYFGPDMFRGISEDFEHRQSDEDLYKCVPTPANNRCVFKWTPEVTSEEFVPNDEEFIVCHFKTHETWELYDEDELRKRDELNQQNQ